MRLNRLAACVTVTLLLAAMVPRAQAQVGGPMSDYMLMRVCTASASPGAAILQGVVPGDAACVYSRQIANGETPPYTMRDFAPNYQIPTSSCPASYGPLLRGNVPVTIGGVTRNVTFSQTASNAICNKASLLSGAVFPDQTSVQYYDPSTGYGSIMGSSGPNGVTLNDSYNLFAQGATTGGIPSTPICKTSNPFVAARFTNSWVVGKSPVSAKIPGPIEYATVNLQLLTPDRYSIQQAAGTACSTPYVGSFHIWRIDWFLFFSGRHLPAVINTHYTQAASNNAGPGSAQQFERTYWTREFGLSRWEKWTRGDLITSGPSPATQAKALLQHATCAQVGRSAGVPHSIITNPADSHVTSSVVLSNVNGVYQRVVGPDGVTQTWYMTLCSDYTNIDRSTTGQSLPAIAPAYLLLWAP